MKKLLQLTDSKQENAVKSILEEHGITYRQSDYGIIDKGFLWVMDSDYARARELLEARVAMDQALAKIQFKEEWRTKWNKSYFVWFFGSILENPARIFRLILLIIFLGLFVWYPIHTLIK